MTLCSACQGIFTKPEWKGKAAKGDTWYHHSDSLTSIKNGRRNGCTVCAMVAIHYDIDSIALDQKFRTEYNIYDVAIHIRCSLNENSRQRVTLATKRVYVTESKEEPCRSVSAAPIEGLEDDGELSPMNTSFSERQAKVWMNECLRNHDMCNQSLMKQQWWPNRLLDLDDPDFPNTVRLISTTDSSPSGSYMTLSHRWGTAKFIKLTKDSLDSFKLGIPLKNLPKTFRDAVVVAKWFNVRYLWIDSLCIIQDSTADWSLEARLMSEVYQYAFCNIAATGALDSSEGLFFNRDFTLVRQSNLKIGLPADWSGKSRQMEILNPDLWKEGIQKTELNKRGWVVQERLLARRVLHFGKRQVFWERRQQRACETYPNGLHYVITTDVDFRSALLASVVGPVEVSLAGKEGIWWSIVRIYSRGQLTRSSDKEIACGGIVKSLETTFKDSCIVGLWKNGMPFQLLWESIYPSTRCPDYRAPSWSWLSIDGEISAGPMGDSRQISNVVVEDIVVTRAGPQNGDRIKSAYIKLKGRMKDARLEIHISSGAHVTIDNYHFQELFVSIDRTVSEWSSGSGSGNVCCLLISSSFFPKSYTGEHKGTGLILRKTPCPGHEGEVYERVGKFKLNAPSIDQVTGLFSRKPRKADQQKQEVLIPVPPPSSRSARTGFFNDDRYEDIPLESIVIV